MRDNGFTLIEVLVSLSLLALVIMGSFAAQREYQILRIQAHYFQEQQEQYSQLREIIENYAPSARTTPIPAQTVRSRAQTPLAQWRDALPTYMHNTLSNSNNNQLAIKLCSAKPTKCLDEKILV